MTTLRTHVAIGSGLAVLTAAFAGFVWLAVGVYSITLPADAAVPFLTRLTTSLGLPYPYHALPGQLVAALSLLITIGWGVKRARAIQSPEGYCLPVVCHLCCLLALFFLLGAGMMAPHVEFQKILVL